MFIAKNRESAKVMFQVEKTDSTRFVQRKRRRANQFAKEMKHQKRSLSKRLETVAPFTSTIHENVNRHSSIDNGTFVATSSLFMIKIKGKSVIILDCSRKPERKSRAVSSKLGKIGKDTSLPVATK